MFRITAVILGTLMATVLFFAATKPDTYRVQRTQSIDAPPEQIFALINDLRRFGSWSPFEKLDPEMRRTYQGAASGEGAVYQWEGDDAAGTGRLTITESSPPSNVTMELDFIEPFESHNIVEFTLEPRGDATYVTWAMRGANSCMSKLMSVFFSMDDMVGAQFEQGLANLETVAETTYRSQW